MRAMTVGPGRKGTAGVETLEQPPVAQGELLVSGRLVGVCGTDREIAEGVYGEPPPGEARLVLGHEGVGEALEAPAGSGFERGDLVVGIVRRPDPVPCPACAAGQWDMCRNDRFVERGIVRADGYGSERWRVESEFAVSLPRKLGDLGVLLEPASVLAKAWDQTERISDRAFFLGGRGLVCGAGRSVYWRVFWVCSAAMRCTWWIWPPEATSCAFGGADRGTLFVTTGREQLDAQALGRQPDAGRVFQVTRLGTHGPGCNLYRGWLPG